MFCGDSKTYAVTEDDKIYAWGMNLENELGFNTHGNPVYKPKLIEGLQNMKILGVYPSTPHTVIHAESEAKGRVILLGKKNDLYTPLSEENGCLHELTFKDQNVNWVAACQDAILAQTESTEEVKREAPEMKELVQTEGSGFKRE